MEDNGRQLKCIDSHGFTRGPRGRFLPGSKGGPGCSHTRKVAELRRAMHDAITIEDVRAVIQALIFEAKQGNVMAAKEFLNRAVGEPLPLDVIDRIAELEALARNLLESRGESFDPIED